MTFLKSAQAAMCPFSKKIMEIFFLFMLLNTWMAEMRTENVWFGWIRPHCVVLPWQHLLHLDDKEHSLQITGASSVLWAMVWQNKSLGLPGNFFLGAWDDSIRWQGHRCYHFKIGDGNCLNLVQGPKDSSLCVGACQEISRGGGGEMFCRKSIVINLLTFP